MQIKIHLLLLLLLGLFSCSGLIDDVDLPFDSSKLVIHGFIHTGADTIEVRVDKTQPVFAGNVDPQGLVVKDARVFITNQTGEIQQLEYCDVKKKYLIATSILPVVEGEIYSLLVEHDEYPTARAHATVPYVNNSFRLVKIDSVIYSYEKIYEITASITDTPGEENFYSLFGFISGTKPERDENGDWIEEEFIYRVFPWNERYSDQNADGLDYIREGRITVTPGSIPKALHFKLFCIDESFYQYSETMIAYDGFSDDEFATPITMFTNIENAYGVFSAYSVFTIDFDFRELENEWSENLR